jgi:hypothetical protein
MVHQPELPVHDGCRSSLLVEELAVVAEDCKQDFAKEAL